MAKNKKNKASEEDLSEEQLNNEASEESTHTDGAEDNESEAASENMDEQAQDEEGVDMTADDRSFLDKLTGKAKPSEKLKKLELEKKELEDKYLRLFAEFDNFKRRTAKERIELVSTAGKDVIKDLLPVLDDIDRALVNETDKEAIEGMTLILNKLNGNLQKRGLKSMEVIGEVFNPDMHEAITEIPAPSDDMKGKIMDVVEKGYYLNDTIIRYPKVVVGK